MWKTPITARKVARHKARREADTKERDNKGLAKRRDGGRCRWPLCGCRKLKLRLEVSHDEHKGMGGNPHGDRSTPDKLITYCVHRHQHGIVSRHKGTLRTRYLTTRRNDGPLAFEVQLDTLAQQLERIPVEAKRAANAGTGWVEVARESKVQQLEPLRPWQTEILEALAEMTI